MNDNSSDRPGFGRPPKHTQFKKGNSGNPKGRPKGSRNFKTELAEELQQTIAVREGSKTKRVSKQRAVVMRSVAKAMQGSDRAAAQVAGWAFKTGADDPSRLTADEVSESQKAIYERHLERVRNETRAEMEANTAKKAQDDEPN